MTDYSLVFPDWFDDLVEWEVEKKGWFSEARLVLSETQYRLSFYDPVRLSQDIESEIQSREFFFEPNLIVVPSVTRVDMEKSIEFLMRSGGIDSFVADR